MTLRGKARELDCGGNSRAFRFDEPDAELCGRVTEFKSSIDTKFGECPLLKVIDEETGEEFSVFASSTILRRKLESLRPCVGDDIDIIFLGQTEKGVKEFKVYLERGGEAILANGNARSGDTAENRVEEDMIPRPPEDDE